MPPLRLPAAAGARLLKPKATEILCIYDHTNNIKSELMNIYDY